MIMVDGVLASCYPSGDHDVLNNILFPIRYFTQLIMWIYGEDYGFSSYILLCSTLRCTLLWIQWSQLQLDLFISLLGLILSFALSVLCIMYESVIQIGSCDDKNVFCFWYSYRSYYGMLWYLPVTHICPWHC